MKRNEKGQVLVLVALAIFVLLGLAALGIDVGFMYSVRHELQRSADAGALAGASALRDYGKDCKELTPNADGTITKDVAIARALDYATRDEVATTPLANNEVLVACPPPPSSPPGTNDDRRVRVDVTRTVDLFFARILAKDNAAISAFAVAEAFPVSQKVECVVPWGIPVPWRENAGSPETFDTGDTFTWPPKESECATMGVTTWTAHAISGLRSPRDQYLCQGSLQVLKIGDPPPKSGNFFGMDLSGLVGAGGCPGKQENPGAGFYYWMITHSCDCDLKIGVGDELPIDSKPGNMVQNTIEAVAPSTYYDGGKNAYLPQGWKNDPDSLMNRDPGSEWVATSDGGAPSTGLSSPRIVRIPIYDPRVDLQGRTTIAPLGFVGFWIQDVVYKTETIDGKTKDLGTVVGRFVTVGGWGAGSGGGPGNAGPAVLNIRLVE